MNLPELLTIPYWNHLARAHLTELIMVLTVAIVVLLDRQIRKLVDNFTKSHGRVFRFTVFLTVCSVGYAVLVLGTAWALKQGLTIQKGAYMAPIVLGILLIVAVSAERQKQM